MSHSHFKSRSTRAKKSCTQGATPLLEQDAQEQHVPSDQAEPRARLSRCSRTSLCRRWCGRRRASGASSRARAVFGLHILWWVVALGMNCLMGFGATSFLEPPAAPSPDDYTAAVPSNTGVIGAMGAVSTILGVVVLLAAASYWPAEDYKGAIWTNAAIFADHLWPRVRLLHHVRGVHAAEQHLCGPLLRGHVLPAPLANVPLCDGVHFRGDAAARASWCRRCSSRSTW